MKYLFQLTIFLAKVLLWSLKFVSISLRGTSTQPVPFPFTVFCTSKSIKKKTTTNSKIIMTAHKTFCGLSRLRTNLPHESQLYILPLPPPLFLEEICAKGAWISPINCIVRCSYTNLRLFLLVKRLLCFGSVHVIVRWKLDYPCQEQHIPTHHVYILHKFFYFFSGGPAGVG